MTTRRSSSSYVSNVHQGYKRLVRMSAEYEKFSSKYSDADSEDLFKPKILTNVVREEKIQTINQRVTRPTANSLRLPPFHSQDQMISVLHRGIRILLLNKDGGLREENRQNTARCPNNIGPRPTAHGCSRPLYNKLWTHPSKDSYERKWRSQARTLTSDFLSAGQLGKSYSLYKLSTQEKSRLGILRKK
ncbi:hypothetical protein Bpfe_007067 [Biomphalaria pfeifferi]|uniref:Uncharacterized protein n=1 Tax=Biomphalaria pfeifferi TaxID=112525 RepID=A0AAD8FHB4_BIOPF|nr:hypothetical protein Bpfe_007067 [Biomphalaria pfeifferi]